MFLEWVEGAAAGHGWIPDVLHPEERRPKSLFGAIRDSPLPFQPEHRIKKKTENHQNQIKHIRISLNEQSKTQKNEQSKTQKKYENMWKITNSSVCFLIR